MPDFPSVPVPTKDPDALLQSVLALKHAVEMLTGQDQGDRFAAHVFVQPDTPTAFHTGDFWLCTATSGSTFNVWNGTKWVKIAAVTLMSDAPAETDFLLHMFKRPA